MGSLVENPIPIADEEEKQNSLPSIFVSERPIEHPTLVKSRPVGNKKRNDQGFACGYLLGLE